MRCQPLVRVSATVTRASAARAGPEPRVSGCAFVMNRYQFLAGFQDKLKLIRIHTLLRHITCGWLRGTLYRSRATHISSHEPMPILLFM